MMRRVANRGLRTRAATVLLAPIVLWAGVACSTRGDLGGNRVLQRMLKQPRYDAYDSSAFFADGKAMQAPPAGTIAREHVVNQPALTDPGPGVDESPIPVTPALLAVGATQYATYCAACHSPAGVGVAVTALAMRIQPPANLQSDSVRALTLGQIYGVVTNGYRWMPPLAASMNVQERWAVTVYLRALQQSYGGKVSPSASPLVAALRQVEAARQADSVANPYAFPADAPTGVRVP